MTVEEMWQAVLRNDAEYDGIFFYAVKTTGIYCRPSCKSRPPKRENICFFENSEQARQAGFRPCKRCRSDLIDYQPMKQIAEHVKRKIETLYREQAKLSEEVNGFGVTERRIADIFKDEYGMTPKTYADKLRLDKAKQFLIKTDMKIIDIAYSVGFGSLSAFYRFFEKEMGITPSEFRKSHPIQNQNRKIKCKQIVALDEVKPAKEEMQGYFALASMLKPMMSGLKIYLGERFESMRLYDYMGVQFGRKEADNDL